MDDGERITAESAVGAGTEFGQEGFEAAVQENTKAIFVGPTTTMSEVLFAYGAAELSGMVITDSEAAFDAVLSGDHKAIFRTGKKLRVIGR